VNPRLLLRASICSDLVPGPATGLRQPVVRGGMLPAAPADTMGWQRGQA
jgi:hypothetical protein